MASKGGNCPYCGGRAFVSHKTFEIKPKWWANFCKACEQWLVHKEDKRVKGGYQHKLKDPKKKPVDVTTDLVTE